MDQTLINQIVEAIFRRTFLASIHLVDAEDLRISNEVFEFDAMPSEGLPHLTIFMPTCDIEFFWNGQPEDSKMELTTQPSFDPSDFKYLLEIEKTIFTKIDALLRASTKQLDLVEEFGILDGEVDE